MAEGGQRSRSFLDSYSKASGDADEVFCDPCKSDDEWKAVVGYCPICDEYLCDTCLGVHRKQKITKAHAILEKTQMPSRHGQGTKSKPDLCVEICHTHHPEIIRYFCKAHDVPGCGDCMTLEHAVCQKDRVQDISDGFQNTKEFKDVDQHLQQLHQELDDMEEQLDNNLETLKITYNNILQKIASVRKEINVYLDQMEKKVTDEAAKMKKEDETKLKTLQRDNQAMKTETEAMLQALHDSNININSLFVISKQTKKRLVTIEQEINTIKQLQQQQQQQQQQQYEFHISKEIENIVSAKTPLGKLSRKPQQNIKTMREKEDQKTQRSTPVVTIDTRATFNRSIDVKCKTDKEDCWIRDCTLLSPDRLVIIDLNNKNVKLIDTSNNTVISTYSTSSTSCSVTVLSTNMIAVTLYGEGKIHVLNVTSTFTLQRKIQVNMGCMGIAYKDGKLAVSYVVPGRVDILDIQGKILHTIQPQQGGECVLQYPHYITFGPDNDTVIVSDWDTDTVSVVTYRGQILRTYTHDTLRHPRGIVITSDGVLFVCSEGSGGCIHVISSDFKTSKIIINHDNHVVEPAGITYCEINHTLYISTTWLDGGDSNNQIHVYDLNVQRTAPMLYAPTYK